MSQGTLILLGKQSVFKHCLALAEAIMWTGSGQEVLVTCWVFSTCLPHPFTLPPSLL